jgi:retron-type reverse transcriptase
MVEEARLFSWCFATTCGRVVSTKPVPTEVDSQATTAGKFPIPLGIPTVANRVVLDAVKNLLESIFEAHFWHVSYGYRPGRSSHGALEHIRLAMRPMAKAKDGRRQRATYRWVIEADIKGSFDHIDHHLLMERIRARIGDMKVTRLIRQFLKANVLEEGFLLPTSKGTPQGGAGVISRCSQHRA